MASSTHWRISRCTKSRTTNTKPVTMVKGCNIRPAGSG
eukprot:CAMPEP_0184461664 /NCGR_PEP_ID=MMETSP0740-20130409/45245_1 /TAXON_ID=385413 /ORGANISM="Thalassiosira miniscula, Strain CCMP1093" /LENGTH=37 /DNA_ID= /DNA_START= /DNA_END= /DNA_ORIENTATION=